MENKQKRLTEQERDEELKDLFHSEVKNTFFLLKHPNTQSTAGQAFMSQKINNLKQMQTFIQTKDKQKNEQSNNSKIKKIFRWIKKVFPFIVYFWPDH